MLGYISVRELKLLRMATNEKTLKVSMKYISVRELKRGSIPVAIFHDFELYQ